MKTIISFILVVCWFLIALLQCNFALTNAQLGSSQEEFDDVSINVAITAYSLEFSLNDTENYSFEKIVCKRVNGMDEEVIGNSQHICKNLYPCSEYLSIIKINRINDQSKVDRTVNSKTFYTTPYTVIKTVDAYVNSINLTWSTRDQSCVSMFAVIAETTEKEIKNQLLNDINYYEFENLDPCQNYSLQLITYVNSTAFISNETATKATEYAEPGDVRFQITNLTDGQTEISWDPPSQKTCVRFFTIKWYQKECSGNEKSTTSTALTNYIDDNESTVANDLSTPEDNNDECVWYDILADPNQSRYILSDLQGCEMFSFELFINVNETAKGKQDFMSAEKTPSAVTKGEGEWTISSQYVKMGWTAPKNHSKCLKIYVVQLIGPIQRGQEETNTIETTDNYALFKDLDPCGQYNVQIKPMSFNSIIGPSMDISFATLEAQPSQILEPSLKAEAYSLEIFWKKPNFADLCLTGYRLSGWKDENVSVAALSTNTTEPYVVFDKDLKSCQTYIVQIIPITATMDGELIQIEVETGAVVVDADKTNFKVITTFSKSFELSVQSEDYNNTCEIIFAHFFCKSIEDVPFSYAEKYVEESIDKSSFKTTLSPLSPYTDYECHVILYNIAGPSKDKQILQKTESYFPEKPEELSLTNSTTGSLMFNWKPPKLPNGNIKLYVLYFQRYDADYFVPPDCSPVNTEPVPQTTAILEHTFTNLQPATKYSMQVAAQNEYGVGQYTLPKVFVTKPWVSEKVTDLKVVTEGPRKSDFQYNASVAVTWKLPCKSNGKIDGFLLNFIGEATDHEREEFQKTVAPDFETTGVMLYNETNLKPEFNYTVTVTVKTLNVADSSPSASEQFEAPAGIPKQLNDDVIANMRVNAYETKHPTTSAIVRIPINALESDLGTILYLALLLSEKACTGTPQLSYDALDSNQDWPKIMSWHEVNNLDSTCIEQYQTTPVRWKPIVDKPTKQSSIEEMIIYTIGDDKCSNNDDQRYCNGPLRADTEYNLVVRLFTKSGFNDVALLDFKTDSAIQVTIILVTCCCCLLLAFIIGLVVLWVRKRIAWHRDSGQGVEDPFGNIIGKNFAIFYSEISKPEKIAREFKEITVAALELSYSASELGCHKNRYADIYPYDKNRVILDIDADGSDYINASFIDGYTRKKEYIATQGPKQESTMDFWRMILQHNVRVIVQVTQFREGNQVKCHEYFPFSSRGINVVIKSKETFESFDRTEMSVSHDKYGLKQKVVHFYFKKWPDHACPSDPLLLVNFIRKVKTEKKPNYSPIVVHCSAGVGRTGTFIGLDIIMQRLKSESKINIFETVKKLRFQRMKMVQTLEQYSFLYKCTYEVVKHKVPRATLKKSTKKVNFKENHEIVVPDDEMNISKHNDYVLTTNPKNYHTSTKSTDVVVLDEHSDKDVHHHIYNSESSM